MMKSLLIALSLLVTIPSLADTLYQTDVGGYGTTVGVGLGTTYSPYIPQTHVDVYGYSVGTNMNGIPYDNFTYPRNAGCCGCNNCNDCGTSYFTRCR